MFAINFYELRKILYNIMHGRIDLSKIIVFKKANLALASRKLAYNEKRRRKKLEKRENLEMHECI